MFIAVDIDGVMRYSNFVYVLDTDDFKLERIAIQDIRDFRLDVDRLLVYSTYVEVIRSFDLDECYRGIYIKTSADMLFINTSIYHIKGVVSLKGGCFYIKLFSSSDRDYFSLGHIELPSINMNKAQGFFMNRSQGILLYICNLSDKFLVKWKLRLFTDTRFFDFYVYCMFNLDGSFDSSYLTVSDNSIKLSLGHNAFPQSLVSKLVLLGA